MGQKHTSVQLQQLFTVTTGKLHYTVMFLPKARAVVAPPPQVDQLEAVITATAEQLTMVGAEVQRGDFTLSRKLLNAAHCPELQHNTTPSFII